MVGSNAISKRKDIKDEKTTKREITDRLIKKYEAEQKIKKQEYNEDPPSDALSGDEAEEAYDGMHPIDYETTHNLTYLRALPELEIPPIDKKCWCPLSRGNRQWHWKNNVSRYVQYHCGNRIKGIQQPLMHHLQEVVNSREPDAMHRYTLEFIEEWQKHE
jgi:hypothetical protein